MDEFQIRQGSQGPACDVHGSYPAADDSEKDEGIQKMRKPIVTSVLNRDDKRACECAFRTDESLVVRGDAHSNKPDIQDEKGAHAPEEGADGTFDRLTGSHRLSGNNGDVFT